MDERKSILEALLDQSWPVANGEDEISSMDQVKAVFLERPGLLDIIHLEAAVGRNPVTDSEMPCVAIRRGNPRVPHWLIGRKICPNDLQARR